MVTANDLLSAARNAAWFDEWQPGNEVYRRVAEMIAWSHNRLDERLAGLASEAEDLRRRLDLRVPHTYGDVAAELRRLADTYEAIDRLGARP